MKCPSPDCGGSARVIDTRHGLDRVKRIRRCNLCGLRFETCEVYTDGVRLSVKRIGAPVLHPDLSGREAEVLALLAEGKTDKEIGAELGISRHTVKNHNGQIFSKLGVRTRLEAALWAVRYGAEA